MSERFLTFLSRTDVWAVGLSMAGFLSLFWLLRGAPLGQAAREESDESPGAAYRDRVVATTVIGFHLVLAGAYLAATAGIPWSLPAFASGFGIVMAVLRANRPYRHVSPTLRRVVGFSNAAMTGSLVAGVLLLGNVLAFKFGGRAIDLTRDLAFSLSPQTIGRIEALDRPLTFYAFFGNSERSIRQLDRVRQLLELYRGSNPARVRIEYFNPFTEAKAFEELVKRIPDISAASGDGIIVAYGEGEAAPHIVLGTRDLFEVPSGPPQQAQADRFVSSFNGEAVVTSALTRLFEGRRNKVAFTTGHGEPSATELDPGQPGIGLWRARLASVGSDVVGVNLLVDEVPEDATLLVICGPKSPFQVDEMGRIKTYLARGGPLMMLVGGGDEPTGLEDLLNTYNVAIGPGLAVDPIYNYRQTAFFVYAPVPPSGKSHPIVSPIAGRVALLQNASPLVILGSGATTGQPKSAKPANSGVMASPFLRTSPSSWSETDAVTRPVKLDRDKEQAGPLNVGVAVTTRPAIESEKPIPRVVVFSTPLVADNRIVAIEPANLDLLMNAVYWLRGKPQLLKIDPKTHETLMFAADPGLQLRLVMVPTLMSAVVIIGLGVTTYLARRD